MAKLPAQFFVHRLVVTPLIGSGAYGEKYGDPVEVPAFISQRRRMVRGLNGVEVLSEALILTDLDYVEQLTPGSLVVLHTEMMGIPLPESSVLAVAYNTDGGMGGWEHLEVNV